MIRYLFAAALAALPALASANTITTYLGNTVVFGDSLSDAGFFGGAQATNGDVWAAQLGLTFASGYNFAVGSARAAPNDGTVDFAEQIANFATAQPRLSGQSQAVVWFGGNDLLNIADRSNPVEIGAALASIQLGVLDLANTYNIDRFVLPGLPDFSTIPAAFGDPAAQAASLGFNSGLVGLVAGLNNIGIEARYVDVAAALAGAQSDPAFPNPTGSCQRGAVSCDGYVFWDPIHPTQAAHAVLAETIAAELAPVPVGATAPMLAGGLVLFALIRRRARLA